MVLRGEASRTSGRLPRPGSPVPRSTAGDKSLIYNAMIEVTEKWKEIFPNASVGVLLITNTVNPANHSDLDIRISEV